MCVCVHYNSPVVQAFCEFVHPGRQLFASFDKQSWLVTTDIIHRFTKYRTILKLEMIITSHLPLNIKTF